MKNLFLVLLFLPLLCAAQTVVHAPGREIPNTYLAQNQFLVGTQLGPVTVATLPNSPSVGQLISVTDGSVPGDCTVGGGTSFNLCGWNGFSWVNPASSGLGVFPSVTTGSLTITGTGGVISMGCQTAPSNPSSGNISFYCNQATGLWECHKSDGTSCAPGGAAFSGISPATNNTAGTFVASGNTWDFTSTTLFKLRVTAGCTTTVVGDLCYDSTSKMWHTWMNGADNFLVTIPVASTVNDQNCVKFVKTGALFNLADAGGLCGSSGSASPINFSSGQAITNTATQFVGAAATGSTESGQQLPVPRPGTVSNLQCRAGTGLSSSQTLTVTVRKGLSSIGLITSSDTAVTCTLNSTNTNGCNDGTHSFSVAAGDVLTIKTVPTNTPSVGLLNCSVQLQ